jgi:uncharacterized protein (DUF924 family)
MTGGNWQDDVIGFWFGELKPEQWFKKDDAVDHTIRARFGGLHARLSGRSASDLLESNETALAAIIVLDQFSRNMFRGSPRSFAQDALALDVAKQAIAKGLSESMNEDERYFLYMPFMHAEDIADQNRCVELFEALDKDEALKYARMHRDIIARFGRFPHRNDLLGRNTTDTEQAHLDEHGGF